MKNRLFVSVVIVALLLTGCSPNVKETEKAVGIINENSDFGGHAFLEIYSGPLYLDYDAKDYNPIDNGPPPYFALPDGTYSSDSDIYGEYLAYPANSKDFRLYIIVIKTADYHLLGIHVGDEIADAEATFSEYGFERGGESSKDDYDEWFYRLHDINICLRIATGDNTIEEIRISVSDPNQKPLDGMT